ncbi:hypothetical protein CC85DRAFT_326115 [Cutaneotrichosporon oleaginosum]|uniref:DNA polymerase delta, subunit 4 n=1 Tax=Cutaneotrichosporon oleaginosum TaxID=879819 RepID=A0A0J0XUT3_9TREE|nr:uncharacterized protein CC85DRAFT_326115 [Cutaneotrichosporon oleaginosum]KLT44835.1 hypothetical protein CC85DRAFT_326115 [Cutaneotrichosporon oleaginosum]TXT11973.1 hypothetical protein COLE_02383 [Cutaneotrichosporon oleaginosum]
MPPRRSTKQSTGLSQPTLSFQTKLRSSKSAKAAAKGGVRKDAVTEARESSPAKDVPSRSSKPKAAKEQETIDLSVEKEKEEKRRVLDPNGKEWNALWRDAKAQMGGMAPIHGDKESKVENILRVFDMTSKYGPYVGITRLERWERAKKWGLQPPEEIKQILLTQQGEDDALYRESVVFGWL